MTVWRGSIFIPVRVCHVVSLRTDPLRRRWLVWTVLAIVFLLVNLYRLSSAVLADRLMAGFNTTGAGLGTLHASFFYIYALMQLPTGILADRAGPRKTATAGAIVFNVGAIGFALAQTYHVAFLSRALIGLGGAVIFISTLRFCANWFRADEFATMNGLTIAIAGLGGIMATTPLALAANAFGWRPTMFGLGVVGLLFAGVVWLLARDSPESAGLEPIEDVETGTTLTLEEVLQNLRAVLAERETWVISLMLFCSTGVLITLLGLWGVPYVVQTQGVSVTTASYYTLLGSFGLLVGPPTFGWVADRFETRTGLIVGGGIVYVAGFGVLTLVPSPHQGIVALIYFTSGATLGAFTLSYAVIKDRHATAASGVSTATVNGAAFLGAAVFPTAMGYALDTYWTGETVAGSRVYTEFGYQVAFGIATAAIVVALCCGLWLHWKLPDG